MSVQQAHHRACLLQTPASPQGRHRRQHLHVMATAAGPKRVAGLALRLGSAHPLAGALGGSGQQFCRLSPTRLSRRWAWGRDRLPPAWWPQPKSWSVAPQWHFHVCIPTGSLLGNTALRPTDQRGGMDTYIRVPDNWITAPSETMPAVPCRRQPPRLNPMCLNPDSSVFTSCALEKSTSS